MEIKVKDIIDLIDYDRDGTVVEVSDGEKVSLLNTGSMLMDLIADYKVASLSAMGSRVVITLIEEEFERRLTQH